MAAPRVCFLDPGRDYVRVKTGFSWPAFFFGTFWASAKKLWVVLCVMLLVEIALYALAAAAQAKGASSLALAQLAIQLVYYVVRGWFGNAWRRASLRRRGYQVVVEKRSPVT